MVKNIIFSTFCFLLLFSQCNVKENGGEYRGYTTLFEKLIPLLKEGNFSDNEIKQLLEINPAKAFEIKIRKKAL